MARATSIAKPLEPFIPETNDEIVNEQFFEEEQTEFGEEEDTLEIAQVPFDENLADYIDDKELRTISTDLIESFDGDKRSRSEWERAYMDGLDYLGMSSEDRDAPFKGACGVVHPVLTEAIVRFQSQAMLEIFPAAGPVRTKIMGNHGRKDPEKDKQALRVQEEMNYILTEKMPEYRWETEQLLFRLPLAGSTFRKVYFDNIEQRPAAIMVTAEDFIVPYGASDLRSCERYTHVMKRTPNELRKDMVMGFYADVDVPEPMAETTNLEETRDKITGQTPSLEKDSRHTLLEMHADYDLGEDQNGVALPYVITIEKSSGIVLSIRRNWRQDDPLRRKRIHFAHYQYMPGLGFYGLGLIHLIGGLAKSSTSILRQLVDAGTLANLPSGFKTRGFRTKNEDDPLEPGEFRDVDIPAGALKDNIFPLPVKEPSATLYQLLQTIVDEARRIASIADLEIGDLNQEAPVGTTFAILERSLKVMSAVHARLHAALKDELRLLAEIIGTRMDPQYEYYFEGEQEQQYNRQEDFSSRVDIIPVSDPNASTMSQRIVQYQAAWQMAQANPDIYNMPLLNRNMLEVMQIKDADQLVPLPDDLQPMDPISENMAFITGQPVKVFTHQDHDAHIQAHMAIVNDPKIAQIIGQTPKAETIRSTAEAHVAEHLAHRYRQQIEQELGTTLPPLNQPLPPETEVALSRLVADAANRLFYKNKDEVAAQKNQELLADPLVQLQLREMSLQEKEFEHKKEMDVANLAEKREARESKEAIELVQSSVDMAEAEEDRISDEAREITRAKAQISRQNSSQNKK